MAGATLALKITGDSRDAVRALDDVDGKASRMDGVFGKMGAGIAAGVGVGVVAIGGLAVSAFNAASDLEQSTGAIDAVFGDWALDIEQAAQGAADSVGLSTSAYENLAAVIGAQLSGTGMVIGDVSNKTQDLVTKGADLAATFGGSTADAVGALGSALKGEFDPLERYGVSLKQSDINARLAAEGNAGLTGEALKQATANAALAIITDQTASSQGAFARESDTAAGSGQRLGAQVDNIKAALGERLLPIFTNVVNWVMDTAIPTWDKWTEKGGPLSDAFDKIGAFIRDELWPVLQDLWKFIQDHVIPIWDSLAAIVRDIVLPVFGKIWQFIKDYVIPMFRDNLGPVFDSVKGFLDKLHDSVVKNKDKFQNFYDNLKPFLDWMRDKLAPFIRDTLVAAFDDATAAIGPTIDAIAWVLDNAGRAIDLLNGGGVSVKGGIGKEVPRNAAQPLRGAAAGMFGAAIPLSAGGGGGVGSGPVVVAAPAGGDTYQITVTGALDPDAVADQIGRLLDRRARMTGRTFAAAL